LEVICQAAGTSLAVQHVRELYREPFGVVAVVIVPLTDDIAIGGVRRDIPEAAQGQLICLGIDKAYAVKGKVGDVALERAQGRKAC
jgi:hypothetical protein